MGWCRTRVCDPAGGCGLVGVSVRLARFEALVPAFEGVFDDRHDKVHARADEALAADPSLGVARGNAGEGRYAWEPGGPGYFFSSL